MTATVELPRRMQRLPRDKHGRVVPWFVAFVDGQPDHRVARGEAAEEALRFKLCWVCGGTLGANLTFVIGPMCVVNRVTAEPPSHRDCSFYSARVCPFLTTPRMRRRESGVPEEATNPGGMMIRRNPGAVAVYTTRSFRVERDDGRLFRLGEPTEVVWLAEGRAATRSEVLESIETGLPLLREVAEGDGAAALAELERMTATALQLIPVVAGSESEDPHG
jgi:hypothetical protein